MPDQLNWIAAAGCAVCLTVGMLVPADADVFNWTYNGQFGQVSDNGSRHVHDRTRRSEA